MSKSETEYENTYLVFSIFKNCKISENCINLKALKNLKPVGKKTIKKLSDMNKHNSKSIRLWFNNNIVPFILSSMFINFIGFILIKK